MPASSTAAAIPEAGGSPSSSAKVQSPMTRPELGFTLDDDASTAVDGFVENIRADVKSIPEAAANDRDASEGWSMSLVYGELSSHSALTLIANGFRLCASARGQKSLVDLGSGEGMPCIVAALFTDFIHAEGIELVTRLHRKAELHLTAARRLASSTTVAEALARATSSSSAVAGSSSESRRAMDPARLDRVTLRIGDFLKDDWSHHDVVFCNATCYDDALLHALFLKLESLAAGAVVILTSHKLTSKLFALLHEGTYDASWGTVTARIYRRLKLPKWVSGVLGKPRR